MTRNNVEDILQFGGTRWDDGLGLMRQTLTSNLALKYGGSNAHSFVASGVDRTVALPTFKAGKYFLIGNSGTSNTITVLNALGATLAILSPGQAAYFLSSALEWIVLAPGITPRPPVNTLTKAIDIVQSGPTSGSTPGPWSYNLITVEDVGNILSTSPPHRDAFDLFQAVSSAFRVNATHGGAQPPIRIAGTFASNFVGTFPNAETVGVIGSAYSNEGPGALWGTIGYASIGPAGAVSALIPVAAEVSAAAGSTVLRRMGFLALTESPVQGSIDDAVLIVASQNVGAGTPGGFKDVIKISNNWFGGSPALDTSANFFSADSATAITNFAKMNNISVAGNIMLCQNLNIPGAVPGFTLPAHVDAAFQYGGTNINGVQFEVDAFTGPALFFGKRANTSSTAPSAVQANEPIAAFVGMPYDGVDYAQTGGIGVRSGQIHTNIAHGTFLAFFTTPLDSTTLTEQMRLNMSGQLNTLFSTATPPGGTTGAGLTFGTTPNFGIFFGVGAPTLAASKGSLYLRSDGSTTNDRMYVNTDGNTTWTAVITAL